MSLITRCPACGTMFKVVPDQLRISDGWVRCGHCAEVFDASAHLLEDAPVFAVPSPPAPAYKQAPAYDAAYNAAYNQAPAHNQAPAVQPAHGIPSNNPERQGATSSFSDSQVDRNLYQLLAEDYAPDSVLPVGTPAAGAPAALDQPSDQPADQAVPVRPSRPARLDDADTDDEPDSQLSESTLESVSFVRDARRKAFWRRPAVRAVLAIVALALLGVLGVQVAVQERDRIAAIEPRTRPWLQQLCLHLQCSVAPLQQIESLVIDSSSFSKLRTDTYRLSFTVKNNAPVALAMPAIELALTDSGDQPVLRRVLLPADLGVTSPVLAAGGEWTGTFPLGVNGAGARIVGYRLLAFYP
ncbi:MAG: DUF3426 domain-containing protein [Bdellovibrionales bacterium]|nr:DUF3426 domain-containing protein [Ramlibacter sp.]